MDEDKINWTILVPAIVQGCLVAVPDVARRKYADPELMAYGRSPIAEETLARGLEVFNCDFVQAYGQTELSPVATFMSAADHRLALGDKPELPLSAAGPFWARSHWSSTKMTTRYPTGPLAKSAFGAPGYEGILEPAGGDGRSHAKRVDARRRRWNPGR